MTATRDPIETGLMVHIRQREPGDRQPGPARTPRAEPRQIWPADRRPQGLRELESGDVAATVDRRLDDRGRTPDPGFGHNGGPPIDPDLPDDPNAAWRLFCWRKASRAAWKTPPREIALRRLQRAEAAGMSYRDYVLEILERGRYL
jgi:hypothetical protein